MKPDTKPVVDAVNDAVAALSDLLRSVRVRARETAADVRKNGRSAKRAIGREAQDVKVRAGEVAQAVRDEARATSYDIGGRLRRAWADLTEHSPNLATSSVAPPRRRRATRRRPAKAARS